MKNNNQISYFILLLLFITSMGCDPENLNPANNELKPKKVATEIPLIVESPHPYETQQSPTNNIVWRDTIIEIGAKFIAPHFSKLELQDGDFLIIRSLDNSRISKYSSNSQIVTESSNGFWGIHIYGEALILEIESNSNTGGYGYDIDKISKGFTDFKNNDTEAICGNDNSDNSICYQNTEPQAYNKSRAVARLLINGQFACTGWLVGEDGHLMTNNHCIQNAQDALNTVVEFMAEGSTCNTDCASWFGCPGIIEANTSTLIQTNVALDYSLIEIANNVSNTYGYLQLRATGPELNEQIYIPQHPAGWGKRIAMNLDNGDAATITALDRPKCTGTGTGDVGYAADTQGGSSGSPVIGYGDHAVVAIHHCANCPNRGVPIDDIITDLGNNLPPGSISEQAWSIVPVSTSNDLYTAHFPSANIGYTGGLNGTILKTEDSGLTWTLKNSGIPNSAAIYSIFFTDNNIGYAVGNFGTAFKTTNGGDSWTNFTLTNANIRNVFFINANKGFIVADGALFKTTDAGTTWDNVNASLPNGIATSDLLSSEIYFRDANNGFILLQGKVLKSTNGGDSWTSITIPALATYDIDFADANIGYICGIGTGVLKTTDGGNSWTEINSFTSNTPQTVNFKNADFGFVGGRYGKIHLTEDGGTTWVEDTSMATNDIHKLIYLETLDKYIAFGKNGTIIQR